MEYSFKVLVWNTNNDRPEYYDVMPYLLECYKSEKKRKVKMWNWDFNESEKQEQTRMPTSVADFKKFILSCSAQQFRARCQYEVLLREMPKDVDMSVIVSEWPNDKEPVKIDVYQQIEANIDVIVKLFMEMV